MARVDYIKCDICGNVINKDNTFPGGFRFRIHKLKNKIDLCDKCISKIKYLSIDVEYLQGVQDAIESMSHHRINKLKG